MKKNISRQQFAHYEFIASCGAVGVKYVFKFPSSQQSCQTHCGFPKLYGSQPSRQNIKRQLNFFIKPTITHPLLDIFPEILQEARIALLYSRLPATKTQSVPFKSPRGFHQEARLRSALCKSRVHTGTCVDVLCS